MARPMIRISIGVNMTLTDRIAFAERLVRHLRAEYHGLISASLPEQVRPRVWSKDQGEQEAFERGLREGLEIVTKGEGT